MEPSDNIIGKRILVGLTYLDTNGDIKEEMTLHGVITEVSKNSIVFERADGNGTFSIPREDELELADLEATYTIRATGEEVNGVSYLSSWTITPPKEDE